MVHASIRNDSDNCVVQIDDKGSNQQVREACRKFGLAHRYWERLHEEQGMETYENWQKLRKDAYSGIGFTVRGTDTIKQENLQIAKQNGKWIMIVKVPEESDSIKFPITLMKTNEFICTNDSMDFPKEIRYWKNGDRMNALVSGDSIRIDFEFKKLE